MRKILFLDMYDDLSDLLTESVRTLEPECQVMVLEDVPFLPAGVESIYEYFILKQEDTILMEKDLYFVFLPVPEYWDIQVDMYNGAVVNLGKKKATIYYRKPYEKRNVQRVEWLTDEGEVYKIDFYNRYGYAYCSDYMDGNGNTRLREYYTTKHETVISINLSNGIVILFNHGVPETVFESKEAFENYAFLNLVSLSEQCVLTSVRQYNICSKKGMGNKVKKIALQTGNELELFRKMNSEFITDTTIYVFHNFTTEKYLIDYAKNEFRALYLPKRKQGDKKKAEILVLTSSDSLHKIEFLIKNLPAVVFHIAANTAVSQKLWALSEYSNVRIYQMVKMDELKNLFNNCSLYLDISNGREIYNAVIRATMNNLLVLGYRTKLHTELYILEECRFEEDEEERMVQLIDLVLNNNQMLERMIEMQRKHIMELCDFIN